MGKAEPVTYHHRRISVDQVTADILGIWYGGEREEIAVAKRGKSSPKTFEGACRLLDSRYNETKSPNLVQFSRQEMRDILVGLLEDVEGRQRSLSVGHVKTALGLLEACDESLVEMLLTGPTRFAEMEMEPDRYEWTGPAVRSFAKRVRNALWNLREALDDKEDAE